MEPVSQRRIDRDVERATRFLRALSTVPAARRVMELAGYTAEEHALGWDHLLFFLGYRSPVPFPEITAEAQKAAIATLDQTDGPMFARATAALQRLHPAQYAFIFDGLSPTTDAGAVATVKTFLDRVAALRDGTDTTRADTREADADSYATLAQRNILSATIEAELRELIDTATSLAPDPGAPDPSQEEAVLERAEAFHAWLTDWRTTARAVVTRRDHRIRMGLTARRVVAEEPAPTADV